MTVARLALVQTLSPVSCRG